MFRPKGDLTLAPTYYERLGVSQGADSTTLRRAFRRLSKSVHPDTTTLPADEAAREFQLLREAYDQLADPRLRRIYDEQLIHQARLRYPKQVPKTSISSPIVSPATAIGERRPLSGGEWLSLLLLLGALVLCLALGVGVAWNRGMELQVQPSWLVAEQTDEEWLIVDGPDGVNASSRNSLESTFSSGP